MNYVIKYKDRFIKITGDNVDKVNSVENASVFNEQEIDTYLSLICSLYPYRFKPKFLKKVMFKGGING